MNGHQADAIASLFENRRFGRLRRRGPRLQRLDEAAERHAAFHFVLPRQFRHVEDVGQRLLPAGPQDEADVRARVIEQRGDGVRRGPAVAMRMQERELLEGAAHVCEVVWQRRWNPERM